MPAGCLSGVAFCRLFPAGTICCRELVGRARIPDPETATCLGGVNGLIAERLPLHSRYIGIRKVFLF